MANRNENDEFRLPVDRTRGVDRTSHTVDRTNGVDRTTRNVDRTTRGIDRTAGVDRTQNRPHTSRSVDRTLGGNRQPSEPLDFFPGLHVGTDDVDITSTAPSRVEEPKPAVPTDAPDLSEMFGEPRAESRDLYSDSHESGSHLPIDEMENLSSSAAPEKVIVHESKAKLTEKQRTLRRIGKIALAAFLICVIVGCIVVTSFAVYVFGFVDSSFDYNLYDLTLDYTTTIYTKDTSYTPEKDTDPQEKWVEYQNLYYENRTWVGINDMDQNIIYAFIAAEDERFYKHKGVDWKRTTASFANLFLHFWDTEQGGSTITQQLVKNLTDDGEHSAMRKIREIMRSRTVESNYAKDTIMECYLNVIYLGNGCYGVEAAAEYYFGKSAKDVTVAEAATLAAIAKSPTGYEPIGNPKNNQQRREWIIKNMCKIRSIYNNERGITEEERDEALQQKVVVLDHKNDSEEGNSSSTANNAYSWFTDTLFQALVEDLMEQKGISEEGATNTIYRGGLKIYSTVDADLQKAAEDVFANDDNWVQVYGTEQKAQGAITIMDYSGHVVAICGGRGVKTGKLELNRATNPRQPGSSMKPIGVYGPALEDNVITWSSMIENTPLKLGGVTFKNSGGYVSEKETIQYAIQRSYNLVAARVYQKYNDPEKLFNFVTERFGITTLIREQVIDGKTYSDIGLSQLALGGSTYGLTTLEEAAAYATFGNGGKYYAPTLYTVVKDHNDNVVLEYDSEPIQAISEETAYIMNQMLTIAATSGTGAGSSFDGWTVFGKTGTTNDNKDRWFAGGTAYYVGSCWFGCDTPFNMARLSSSSNPAIKLWRPIMQAAHQGLAKKTIAMPSGVIKARYCKESGGLATDACHEVEWGYYKKDYAPVCTVHSGKTLGKDDPDPQSQASGETTSSETATSGEGASGEAPAEGTGE